MQRLPQINYWLELITLPRLADRGTADWIYACHAARNWDTPSNGVFLLFTYEELWGRDLSKRVYWRGLLKDALEARERRLIREFQRHSRQHLTHYFDDEIWTIYAT